MITREKHHVKYVLRETLVEVIEEYRNKEDSLGGPGYYPREYVIISNEKELPLGGIQDVVKRIAKAS